MSKEHYLPKVVVTLLVIAFDLGYGTTMIDQNTTTILPLKRRVLLLGGSGTIGSATLHALHQAGYHVTCPLRRDTMESNKLKLFKDADCVDLSHLTSRAELTKFFEGRHFDAVISCVAARKGMPSDAWAVDYEFNRHFLKSACQHSVSQFVLLSAICVQKPRLEFQKAKLAFECLLQQSGVTWTIVRPTAYFKSLSGQFNRVKSGKAFLVFGDGKLNACKPISDGDVGLFLVRALDDRHMHNKILPIGGPGGALTPLDQGELMFEACVEKKPRFRHVPIQFMNIVASTLSCSRGLHPKLANMAEYARIGQYYARESMLVWNNNTNTYDADLTPEFGTHTLQDFYKSLALGHAQVHLGQQAFFK